MTKFFEFLLTSTEGVTPWLRILLVFVLTGLSFAGVMFAKSNKFRKHVILLFQMTFKRSQRKKIELLKHDLFLKKALYLKSLSNIEFNSDTKTELFRILLHEKITAAISISEKFIKDVDCKDENELYIRCIENIENIIDTYETAISQAYYEYFFNNGNYNKKDAYIVAQKEFKFIYTKFKEYHNRNVEDMLRNIESFFKSKIFTVRQKLYFYLMTIQKAVEVAITDCEEIFVNFNGEIDKIARMEDNLH